ncbi:MAG: hypothetical protein ACOYUZ_02110 [Patescibacteria group bacterium]
MNEIDSLLKELLEKLPADRIFIRDNQIIYYDFEGVTSRIDQAEAELTELYVKRTAEEKLGYQIRITAWNMGKNGHYSHRFRAVFPQDP